MQTYLEAKKAFAKAKREERKRLELIIHPNPVFNGVEILHFHQAGKVSFVSEKAPLDAKFVLKKGDILELTGRDEFLTLYAKDLDWLSKITSR